jgi:hypothetical protein
MVDKAFRIELNISKGRCLEKDIALSNIEALENLY